MLREVEVSAPSWQEGMTRVREPRVKDFLAARAVTDEQERTVLMLGSMVLDKDGKPVGKDAILEGSVAALEELSAVIPQLLSRKKEGDAGAPLTQPSD
jgi:hypothetical protein